MTIQFKHGGKPKKLAVGISTFDECKGLERLILQIFGEVDCIIVVNGRYTNFNTDHDFSIDGTKELCNHYKDVYYDEFTGWEYEKRQRIFDIAGNLGMDYLIVIDSDEYIDTEYMDWNKLHQELEDADKDVYHQFDFVYNLLLWIDRGWPQASNNYKTNAWHYAPRVFRNPGKLRYALQTHYRFAFRCISDELIINNPDIPLCIGPTMTLSGIRLTTDAEFRSPEYLKVREQWSHDTVHEDRANVFYQEMVASGKQFKIKDKNLPHYFDENGRRIEGKRPLISYNL